MRYKRPNPYNSIISLCVFFRRTTVVSFETNSSISYIFSMVNELQQGHLLWTGRISNPLIAPSHTHTKTCSTGANIQCHKGISHINLSGHPDRDIYTSHYLATNRLKHILTAEELVCKIRNKCKCVDYCNLEFINYMEQSPS